MPSVSFTYTGAVQTWDVPANVVNVTIEVWGAEGGREVSGVTRRYGGYAKGNLSVTPGETLNLYVGGMPAIGARLGGWNGGGDGGAHQDSTYDGCGGGGATDVRQGGTALTNRKIIGAGAGGSTGRDANATPPEGVRRGGHGGASTGERGDGVSQAGGGYGGSQSAGGDYDGALGNGGNGEGGSLTNNGVEGSGGGGGGGYYGGGGGARGPHLENPFGGFDAVQGRGGGGGSNYTGGVTSASSTRGVRAGNGLIKITYTEPPNPPTDVTPVAEATVSTDVPTLGATVQTHPESSTMKSRVEWQLASDSGFTSNVRTITEPTSDLRASGATTEVVPDADQLFQGTWFIRARAIDEGGNLSDWTAGHSFTVSHPPTTTSHAPTGGVTRDYGASGEVTFSWAFSDSSPVDDQTAFEIEVSRNSDGFILLAPGKQASTDQSEVLTIPSGEKDNTLRWRIRVWDSDDVVGAWSDYHLFKVSDPPTANITFPAVDGDDVNNAQPTFTWDFVASGGRTQASFRVIVREGAAEVHNSGVVSSSATSYQLPDPVLENSKTYEVEVRVTDNVNLQGTGTRTFDTVWLPPDAPVATVTDHTSTLGYISVEWDNSNQDPDFISYSVYRRVDGGPWKRLTTITEVETTYDYHDWLIEVGRSYEYAVTQTAEVDGDVLESDKNALGPVEPSSDKYWLISEDDESLNFQLRHVISDEFTEVYEQQETVVIGRGRHVDEGERQGFGGSLQAELRDIPAGDTARVQRNKILGMKEAQEAVYLRNPFGDLWLVSIGDVAFTRISGMSTREFSNVTIPYVEVA